MRRLCPAFSSSFSFAFIALAWYIGISRYRIAGDAAEEQRQVIQLAMVNRDVTSM